MKKILYLFLILTLICIFLLCSCADDNNSTDSSLNGNDASESSMATGDPATCQHAFGEWVITKEATCARTGKSERTCSLCSATEKQTIQKTEEHSASNWIVNVKATCKEEGEKQKKCTVCKKVLESEKIEKSAAHTGVKSNFDMPSGTFCGDEGTCFVTISCSDCDKKISSGYQDIPEKHNMENDACQACGLPQSTTAGIYFGLNPDGKSYFASPAKDFAGGKVVIGVYNNLSVTVVDSFFAYNDSLTTIIISDCVEEIGSFEGCTELGWVSIGNRVKEIPAYAFRYCSDLSTIIIGDSVEKIGEKAFTGCNNLYYAYISGSHDWMCGGDTIYGRWIGKEDAMEGYFAEYLKEKPWEWYRK